VPKVNCHHRTAWAQSQTKNEEFQKKYAQITNKFSYQFMKHFCVDGISDWDTLVKFNSSGEFSDRKWIKSLDESGK